MYKQNHQFIVYKLDSNHMPIGEFIWDFRS